MHCDKFVDFQDLTINLQNLNGAFIGRHYTLIKELSDRGSNVKIFDASSDSQEMYVIKALKVLPETIQSIENEVNALEELQGHPHICELIQVIKYSNWWFLVMPKYDGDLSMLVKKKGLSEKSIQLILNQLVSALGYMHSKGYYHGDIKIDNVFVTNNPFSVKLADFGWTSRQKSTLSELINNGKMSPEFSNQGFTYLADKNDVWSLAVLLMDLIKGRSVNWTKYVNSIQEFKKRFGLSKDLTEVLSKVFKPEMDRISLDEFSSEISRLPKLKSHRLPHLLTSFM